jgi:flavin reductase (DIM6/NTAB) family NADH-FMN oxidoreductase RutF
MILDVAQLSVIERYKLLVGAIVPRPIAFVSTTSREGAHNLAPYSFFNGVGSDPMTLLFCPANNAAGHEKDSLVNASPPPDGLGEFVVNIVADSFARQMAMTAEELPWGESEFELSGLTPAPCKAVRAPRVAESPVAFECLTREVVRLNPGAPAGGNVVIGEVVRVHVDDAMIDDRMRIDAEQLRAIGRMAGNDYVTTRDRFELPRGRGAMHT